MKKITQFFKSLLFLPVVIIFALYIYWLIVIPTSVSSLFVLIFLVAIYFAGTVVVRLFEKHWKPSLIIFLILLPISIYVVILEIWAHLWLTTDVGIHNHVIGVILAIVLLATHTILTFQNKTAKMPLLLFTVMLPFFVLYFGYFVVFYLSTEIIEKAQFGNYTYIILDEKDSDFHGYETFYKCYKWGLTCENLYSDYSSMGWKIIIDEQNKEVSLFEEGTSSLVYTDGKNPRAYNGTGGILYDHLYYLSEQCNNLNNDKGYYKCESYTYIPYNCNMRSVLCESIPIQYKEDNYDYYYWVEDELKNEISLYNENDALIFTYGEHPRCYVDGCEILKQDSATP